MGMVCQRLRVSGAPRQAALEDGAAAAGAALGAVEAAGAAAGAAAG